MNSIIRFFHIITFNIFNPQPVIEENTSSHISKEYYGFEYQNGKHKGKVVLFIDTSETLFKSKPFEPGTRQIEFDEVDRDDRENLQSLNPNVEQWTYRRQIKHQLSKDKLSEILDAFAPY